MHEIPEKALRCFEQWSGLKITFYDWSDSFTHCFALERRRHEHDLCRVKKCFRYAACFEFDYHLPRRKAWILREGAVKICHAGALELVISIFSGNRFLAIATAGLCRPPKLLPPGIPVSREDTAGPYPELSQLPEISPEEIELKLEGLRQLAARLKCWYEAKGGELFRGEKMPRASLIKYTVQERALKGLTLEDMAKILHLSDKRAAAAIRETTGKTLGELVREQRMQRARILLEHTDRPVAEIALSSGYPDLANFHRQFKKLENRTPAQYRRASRRKAE